MTATAAKLAPALVTTDELLELAEWERKHSDAKKKVSTAEKELEFRRMQLAEKVLGVKSKDELKELSPKEVDRLGAKRFEHGDWKPERGAPVFSFSKTSSGRYPAWRALFVAELGETAAAQISLETPLQFSYCVEVSPL